MLDDLLYMLARNPLLLILVIVAVFYIAKKSGAPKNGRAQGGDAIESGSLIAAFERPKHISFWDFYDNSAWR